MNKETRLFIWGLIQFAIGVALFCINFIVSPERDFEYYFFQGVYLILIIIGVDKINKTV